MRRNFLIALTFAAGLAAPLAASAQDSRADQKAESDAAADAKRKGEWNLPQGILPDVNAAGPCPFVKVLYDAGRYQEFKGREASSTVGFTGEIENLRAACTYKTDTPITVKMNVLFALGRGPTAEGDTKNYRYWVAVTLRNKQLVSKQYFDMPVKFDPGEDRVYQNEELDQIVIPRANDKVSGNNFEILVGFDVTPQMAEFNREGKRFRITAVAAAPNQ